MADLGVAGLQFPNINRPEKIEEIIENAIAMIDPNFDHPYAWNGLPPELLNDAKELWKVN